MSEKAKDILIDVFFFILSLSVALWSFKTSSHATFVIMSIFALRSAYNIFKALTSSSE